METVRSQTLYSFVCSVVYARVLCQTGVRCSQATLHVQLPEHNRFARVALVLFVPTDGVRYGSARDRERAASRINPRDARFANAQTRSLQSRSTGVQNHPKK